MLNILFTEPHLESLTGVSEGDTRRKGRGKHYGSVSLCVCVCLDKRVVGLLENRHGPCKPLQFHYNNGGSDLNKDTRAGGSLGGTQILHNPPIYRAAQEKTTSLSFIRRELQSCFALLISGVGRSGTTDH